MNGSANMARSNKALAQLPAATPAATVIAIVVTAVAVLLATSYMPQSKKKAPLINLGVLAGGASVDLAGIVSRYVAHLYLRSRRLC